LKSKVDIEVAMGIEILNRKNIRRQTLDLNQNFAIVGVITNKQ
jgi:hypothetical protein